MLRVLSCQSLLARWGPEPSSCCKTPWIRQGSVNLRTSTLGDDCSCRARLGGPAPVEPEALGRHGACQACDRSGQAVARPVLLAQASSTAAVPGLSLEAALRRFAEAVQAQTVDTSRRMGDIRACLDAPEVALDDKAELLEELVEIVENVDDARSAHRPCMRHSPLGTCPAQGAVLLRACRRRQGKSATALACP